MLLGLLNELVLLRLHRVNFFLNRPLTVELVLLVIIRGHDDKRGWRITGWLFIGFD